MSARDIALKQIENTLSTLHTFCEDFEMDHGDEYYASDEKGMSLLTLIAVIQRASDGDLSKKVHKLSYDSDVENASLKVSTALGRDD